MVENMNPLSPEKGGAVQWLKAQNVKPDRSGF